MEPFKNAPTITNYRIHQSVSVSGSRFGAPRILEKYYATASLRATISLRVHLDFGPRVLYRDYFDLDAQVYATSVHDLLHSKPSCPSSALIITLQGSLNETWILGRIKSPCRWILLVVVDKLSKPQADVFKRRLRENFPLRLVASSVKRNRQTSVGKGESRCANHTEGGCSYSTLSPP